MSKLTELALASYNLEKQAQDSTEKKIARGAGAVGGGVIGGHIGSNIGGLAGALIGGAISRRPLDGAATGAVVGGIAGGVTGLYQGGKLGHRVVKNLQKEAAFTPITPVAKGTGAIIENGSTMPVKTPLALRPSGGMATGLEGAAKSGMSAKMKLGLAGGALALGAGAMALMHKKKQDDGQVKAAADYDWKDLAKSTAATTGGAVLGTAVGGLLAGPIGGAYGAVSGALGGYHRWGKGMHSNGKPVRTHTEAETHTPAAAVGRAAGIGAAAYVGQEVGKHFGYHLAPAFSKSKLPGPLKKARSAGYLLGAATGALAGGFTANHAMNQHVKKAEKDAGLAKEEKDNVGPFKADAGAEADKPGKGESTKGKSLLIAAAQEQMAKAASKQK